MDNLKIYLLVPYLIAGFGCVVMGVPLILGRIPPNAWYGFRVKRTLEDPAVWYPANRYAGFHMVGLGIAWVVVAGVLYFVPQVSFVGYALTCLGVVVAGLAVGLVRSFRHLGRLGKRDAT